jgi:hypothetical protein
MLKGCAAMRSPRQEPGFSRLAWVETAAGRSFTRRAAQLLLGLLLILTLGGCALNIGSPSSPNPILNPLPASCATTATATAHSWVSADRQIVGTHNGNPTIVQFSKFVYPLGLPNEDVFGPAAPGFTTWSPDGKHLATLVEIVAPSVRFSYPYVVDTTTQAVTQVQLPAGMQMESPVFMEWARERSIAWADNNTLQIFAVMPVPFMIGGTAASNTTSYRYDITTQTLTPLPGVTTALQGSVRCGTLAYLEMDQMKQYQICQRAVSAYWYVGGAYLRRYDLATQTQIGQPYYLGMTSSCPYAFDFQAEAMGWDVTADGKTLVYQETLDSPGPPVWPTDISVQAVSQFKVVDLTTPGASPTQILTGAKSNASAHLAISPDQKSVAVVATDALINANPSNPLVYTGSISGGAASAHDPSGGGLPAWNADSNGFDTSGLWDDIPGATSPHLEQWQVAMPHVVATIDAEHHPASLP